MSKFYESYDKWSKIYEAKKNPKWAKKVTKQIKGGKMRELLGVSADEKIEDVYSDPKKLADDLVKALNGNKKKAAGMLSFVANVRKGVEVFSKALKLIKDVDSKE